MLDILSADGLLDYEAREEKIPLKEEAVSKIKKLVGADFIKTT